MKTGRKAKHYVAKDGTQIKGLAYDKGMSRWRLIGTGKTFREPDEAKAIERFKRMTGVKASPAQLQTMGFEYDATDPEQMAIYGPNGILSRGAWDASKRLWAYVTQQIARRPLWCAQQTGIEQIGYLTNVKPPAVPPTLDAVKKLWETKNTVTRKESLKVIAAWSGFVASTKVQGLPDITEEVIGAFRDDVRARGHKPKYQRHIFHRVRRVLKFAIQEGNGIDKGELRRVVSLMDNLTPVGEDNSLDPKPIEVKDWRRLLAKAQGDNRAMILLMLNAALYTQEVIDLKWDMIKQGKFLVAHRKKKGLFLRVAELWPETIEALSKIERKGEFIFWSIQGKKLGIKGAELRFRKLREDADVPHVTTSQMRDGALTAATVAGVSSDMIRLFAGHSNNIQDHYAKRNPAMVKPATDAVYRHYFPGK